VREKEFQQGKLGHPVSLKSTKAPGQCDRTTSE
jgi:hypothetical protein